MQFSRGKNFQVMRKFPIYLQGDPEWHPLVGQKPSKMRTCLSGTSISKNMAQPRVSLPSMTKLENCTKRSRKTFMMLLLGDGWMVFGLEICT